LLVANLLIYKRWKGPVPYPEIPVPPKPKLAIIIDDLGYNPLTAKTLYQINPSITLAIIPHQPYSKQIAQLAETLGQEVLIHLPMEPQHINNYSKIPHMLLMNMKKNELEQNLRYNLDDFPSAVGVNNHMGSRMTEDEKQMIIVLSELKRRGLFFIDSRTTPHSKAYLLAKQLGLKAAKRDIFLDNEDRIESILSQLNNLIALAQKNGKALGIGHPRTNTLTALKRFSKEDKIQTVQLVPVSQLLDE
jgi:polysaccharide deacetylase 2 family uncharacterized protein YibQ